MMQWSTTLAADLDEEQGLVLLTEPVPPEARWPFRVVLDKGTENAELAYLTGRGADGLTYSIERGVLGSDSFPHAAGTIIERSIPTAPLGQSSGGAGTEGPAGKSAYQIARDHGYGGTETQWLATLAGERGPKGEPGDDGADGSDGAPGADGEPGAAGLSLHSGDGPPDSGMGSANDAYIEGLTGDLWRKTGGTWGVVGNIRGPQGGPGPASTVPGPDGQPGAKGEPGEPGQPGADSTVPGPDGASAYDVARAHGYGGTEAQWLATLKGEKGDKGDKGDAGAAGAPGTPGTDGANSTVPGPSGASAYDLAVANGFVGNLSQWLASLVGPKGDTGSPGPAASIPAGIIVMWSGTLATVPSGWALCNGLNGTPDLRDKFVKGAANGQNPGATGGSSTHTHAGHSDHPALPHSGAAVANHTDVVNHVHAERLQGGTTGTTTGTHLMGSAATGGSLRSAGQSTLDPTSGGVAAQVHQVTQPSQHGAQSHSPHDSPLNEPPFYAMAFIMKLAQG